MCLRTAGFLKSMSPTVSSAVKTAVKPLRPFRPAALLSLACYFLSSLLLWGTSDDLARLGVPSRAVPQGLLDFQGHLR